MLVLLYTRLQNDCNFSKPRGCLGEFLSLFRGLVFRVRFNFIGRVCSRILVATWDSFVENGECIVFHPPRLVVQVEEGSKCPNYLLRRHERESGTPSAPSGKVYEHRHGELM